MSSHLVAVIGAVCGAAASFPMLYVLASVQKRHAPITFGVVLSCGLAPFVVLQVIMLAVNFIVHEAAVTFGIFASVTFLVVVLLATLLSKPWR